MTATPTISVIITTYNYAAFIVGAIESVLNQTCPAHEIFVIDDGSTDATPQLVAPFVERGLVTYIHQPNQGPSAARNNGIRRSTGDLVAFLDADDTWLPRKLELQSTWLAAHPQASMVSAPMIWWDVDQNDQRIVAMKSMSSARVRRELAVRNDVGNPSATLIRRSAIEQVGLFDDSLRWGQDWEIFVRLSRAGEIGFIDEPVIVYRWHGASLSHEGLRLQLAVHHSIARRAIAGHQPAWERPILRTRAWSMIEFERARVVRLEHGPRMLWIRHSLLALVSWPFEQSVAKLTLFGRSLIGEAAYQRTVTSLRGVRRRTAGQRPVR